MGRQDRRGLALVVASGRGRRGRALRPVHGQGQRRLPHRQLPGDHSGLRRAVEDGGPAEGLQLAELVRRKVLDQHGSGRLHGSGAGAAARRLLALAPDSLWAGTFRRGLHLGAVPVDDEQGPGRRAGQLRQPHRQVHRVQVRRRPAGRRRGRAAGDQAGRRHQVRAGRTDRRVRGHGVPQGGPGRARPVGPGQ
uniref:DUF222 domain-containing protein n=1 Tax=Parastrongyloides trichosuri TaxID=131310 RepID=A0A0N4Z7G7_PARTI